MAAWLSKSPNIKSTTVIQLAKQHKQSGGDQNVRNGGGSGCHHRGKHRSKHLFEGSDESNQAAGLVPGNTELSGYFVKVKLETPSNLDMQ